LTAPDHRARISELKTQVENLADGIASGMIKPSPTMAGKLGSAEAELEQLQAADATVTKTPEADVSMLLANLPELALRAVDQLERTLASGDVPRARTEIKEHVGMVEVEADAQEIRLYSAQGVTAALLRVVGAHSSIDGSGGPLL
jgi:hypothetical protein